MEDLVITYEHQRRRHHGECPRYLPRGWLGTLFEHTLNELLAALQAVESAIRDHLSSSLTYTASVFTRLQTACPFLYSYEKASHHTCTHIVMDKIDHIDRLAVYVL